MAQIMRYPEDGWLSLYLLVQELDTVISLSPPYSVQELDEKEKKRDLITYSFSLDLLLSLKKKRERNLI